MVVSVAAEVTEICLSNEAIARENRLWYNIYEIAIWEIEVW